ncbi:hypothetical protein BU24DRAFT_416414 [Aaosphaeria arxii CBS 175.79]|uniref:Uncharacterized protein n=1 Tax=Aaosphaeria arxii CBS 175.79 TaxID=1450172 RepID=A0A6A5Y7J6_9PLEO|nr:uncharacterized protein BU24DRAFT_416414 [Aaosphaeria arxii CBS 175.79]KAF2020721.1 hypothetical protein BU24DRAFT_416414 [Aaosphaeria arxii CBS 175.79]
MCKVSPRKVFSSSSLLLSPRGLCFGYNSCEWKGYERTGTLVRPGIVMMQVQKRLMNSGGTVASVIDNYLLGNVIFHHRARFEWYYNESTLW